MASSTFAIPMELEVIRQLLQDNRKQLEVIRQLLQDNRQELEVIRQLL